MSAERPRLRVLAERLGIASAYWDLSGHEWITSDATREALLAAMGRDVSTEAAAAGALEALDRELAECTLDPVLVWREFGDAVPEVPLRLPAGVGALAWRLELHEEGGRLHTSEGRLPEPGPGSDAASGPRAVLALPARPSCGYHELVLQLEGAAFARRARQRFVMAPRTALPVEEVLAGGARAFGLWANLYTVRSRRNWGHGDVGDLRALLRWCAEAGGAFVGVNPLHAVPNRGLAITPYSPSSRLYRNVLYLDVEAVPEWAGCEGARARLREPGFRPRLARLRAAASIEHGAVLDAKLAVLRELHACFRALPASSPRVAAWERYRAREGRTLVDFATWEALAEHFGGRAEPDTAWWRWPEPFRDPDSHAVEAFRREHGHEVEFRAWLQFELDAQLAAAAKEGRDAGLAIGLYQDLAIGSARDSADTWMHRRLFALGACAGAPPDDYAPAGQNWGFPPLDPHRLRADGYRFFERLLRANFAHSGALRIDHAMGMMRMFWIPEGRPGTEGAYVYARVDDLLGILALESRRHGALAIGEDLGTVPPEFRERMRDWGLLGSAVMYFERDEEVFRPASAWSARALATVETHDLVPVAGHREGRDLEIRRRAGQIADDAELARALEARAREHEALLERLRAEGCLAGEGVPSPEELCVAVHAFLARTPAPLVAASLDDLALEREPVNVPGVPVDRHPSWSRRMQAPLETLRGDAVAARALAALAEGRSSAG